MVIPTVSILMLYLEKILTMLFNIFKSITTTVLQVGSLSAIHPGESFFH